MEWKAEKMHGWTKYTSGHYTIEKEDDHDYSVWFKTDIVGGASSVALAKQVALTHSDKLEFEGV